MQQHWNKKADWSKKPNPWHTGEPTEEGDYVLRMKFQNFRYDVAHYKDGKFISYHDHYLHLEDIIEWQKIEPYEAGKERE